MTIYHVDKIVRETKQIIKDGSTNIYVNTKVKDGTDISELMSLFLQKEVNDPKFPKLSNRVNYLKNNQEGVRAMCDVVERYAADRSYYPPSELDACWGVFYCTETSCRKI